MSLKKFYRIFFLKKHCMGVQNDCRVQQGIKFKGDLAQP